MENRVDLQRSPVSAYIQLSTLFRRSIEYGEWPVGEQIPTLQDLTREFKVAPATVRRALSSLIEEGLLSAQRGKGTFVVGVPETRLWREIEADADGAFHPRQGADIELLLKRQVEAPPIRPHQGELTSSYLHLRRLYSKNKRPFLLADVYIDASATDGIKPRDLGTKTGLELIELAKFKIAGVRQTLTVHSADLEVSRRLQIPLNSPVARIDRTRYDASGLAVMVSTGTYRGDIVRVDFNSGTTPKQQD